MPRLLHSAVRPHRYKSLQEIAARQSGSSMSITRRTFVTLTAAALAPPAFAETRPIKAIAFDGFPIIDSRPVFAKVEELFPGKGAAISDAWRTRLFEYT